MKNRNALWTIAASILIASFGCSFVAGQETANQDPDVLATGSNNSPSSAHETSEQAASTADEGVLAIPDSSTTTLVATSEGPGSDPLSVPGGPTVTIEPNPTSSLAVGKDWQTIVSLLGPATLPSDCPIPLDEVASMPGAERSYRSGVHQGLDFICEAKGRIAVAARDGRVAFVQRSYVEPTPADRSAMLGIAAQTGQTPPWTLNRLYGNVVVIDHGVIQGVGHTVTIYAHLADVADLTTGQAIEAGTVLGEIGNTGTNAASTGTNRPRSIHLHWELHVDGIYLGQGLNPCETRSLYASLFSIHLSQPCPF